MEIGLSTRLFANQRLNSHILDQVYAAGFRSLEIFAARQHLDYHDANHVRDVAQWFEDHEVSLHSVHAPLFSDFDWGRSGGFPISLAYTEKRRRVDSMDEVKRTIEIAERLPFRFLVAHLGLAEDPYDPSKFDAAFTSLEHLRIFAKERGTMILLENMPGELRAPERLAEFLQMTRLGLQVCFDTGHAYLTGGVAPAFERLEPLIAAVHLHDNRGDLDDHLLPFQGSIDWPAAMKSLQTLDGTVAGLVEPHHRDYDAAAMARVREAIQKIEALTRAE